MQQVSRQFSVYPLGGADLGGGIDAALAAVGRHGLQVAGSASAAAA